MNDSLIRMLFLVHLASCLYMVGAIWFVQIVHYPLFASVGRSEFPYYERRHTKIVTWVVAPPMLIEGTTASILFWFRPAGVSNWALGTGLALLGVIWLSTALVQVPCHEVLSRDFNPDVHHIFRDTAMAKIFHRPRRTSRPGTVCPGSLQRSDKTYARDEWRPVASGPAKRVN